MDTDLDEDEDMRELEALLYSSIHHGCNNENTLQDTSCPNELDAFSSPDTQTLSLYTVSVTEPSSTLLLRGVTNLQALESFDFFAALSSNISPPLAPQNVSKSKSAVSPRKSHSPPNLYNTTETESFAEEVIYSNHHSPIISVLSSSPSLSDSLLPLDNASSGLLKQKTSILPWDEKQTPAENVGRQHSGCGTHQNPYYVSSDCESIGGSSKQNTIKYLCSPSKTEQARPPHDGGSVSQDGVICPKEVLKSEQIPQTTSHSAALPKQQSQTKGVASKVKEQPSTLSFPVPVTTSSKPKRSAQIWVDKSRSISQVDVDKSKSSSHSETKSSLTLKSSTHLNSFISLADFTDSITLNSDSLGKSLRRLMGISACKVKNLKGSQQEVGMDKNRLKPVKSEQVLIESDSSQSFSSDDDTDSESSLDSSLQADRFKRGEKKIEPFFGTKGDDTESDSGSNSRKDSSSMDDSGSSGHELDLNWNVNASDEHIIRTLAKDAFREVDSTKWQVNEMDVNREVNVRIVSRYYPKTNVRCHNCNETGHLSKVCPQPRKKPLCSQCGVYGHSIHHCPNRLCYNCEEPGHTSLDCTFPRRNPNSICLRCQMPGHKISQCTDLWRQYHMTVSLDNLIIMEKKMNSTVYCCNCGHKGHFGYACKDSRMERHVLPVYPFVAEYDRDFKTKCSRQDTTSGYLKSKQQQHLKRNPKGSSKKLHKQQKDEACDQSYTKDGDYRHISKKQKHCKDNSVEQSYTQDSEYRHISIKQGQWKDNLGNQSYTQSSQYKPGSKKQEMWKDNPQDQSCIQNTKYRCLSEKQAQWKDNSQDQSYTQNSKYRHISQQQGQWEDNPHDQSYTQNTEYRHISQNCRQREDYSQCQFSMKDMQNRHTSLNPGQWEDNSHGPSYAKNIAYRHIPQKQGLWKDNSPDQLSTQNDEYRHTPQKQEHWEDNSKDHQLYTHGSAYRHISRQQVHWEGNSQDHQSYTHSSEYRHVSRQQEVLSHTSLKSNQSLNGGKSAREKGEDRNHRQQEITSAKRKSGIQEHTFLSHMPDPYTRTFESSEFRETRKEKKRQFETNEGLSNVSQVQRRKRKNPQSSEKFQRHQKEKSALHHLQNFSREDISSGWMLTDIPAHRKLNKKSAGWKSSMSEQASSVSPKQTIHRPASMKSETHQRCFTSPVPDLQASKRQHEQYDRGEELYTKVSKREPQSLRKNRNRRKNSGPALLNSDIRVQQGQTSRKHKSTFNSAQTIIAQSNKPFHDLKVSKERQIIQSANGFRIAISNINLNKIYQNRQHDMN